MSDHGIAGMLGLWRPVFSVFSAVVVGLGAVLEPSMTFAAVISALLAGIYWSRPILVPIFIVASELVVHPVSQVGGFNVFLSDLVWLSAIPMVLLSRTASSRFVAFGAFRLPMSVLLATAALSTLVAHDVARALVGTVQLLELFAIAWVTVSLVRSPRQIVTVLVFSTIAVAADAALAVGQLVDLVPIQQLPLEPGSEAGRVTGVSGNALGTFLALGFVLGLGLSLSLPRRSIWTFTAMNLGIMLALVTTGIRSAWLSAALGLVVSVTLSAVHARQLAMSRFVGILGTVATLGAFTALLMERMALPAVYLARLSSMTSFAEASTGSTTYVRLQFWATSLRMIEDNPWLGVGPKNWVVTKSQYGLPEHVVGLSTSKIADPHHALLELAAEQGLLAAFTMLTIYMMCGRRCLRGLRSGTWEPAVAVPLALVSLTRPLAQVLGGDLGSEKTWYVFFGLALSAMYHYERRAADVSSSDGYRKRPTNFRTGQAFSNFE